MNTPRYIIPAFFSLALCALPADRAAAQNVLQNPGFDTPTNSATPMAAFVISGAGASGPSAAADFSMYNNAAATTTTSLLPSTDTLAPGGSYMIHIVSSGLNDGLNQLYTPFVGAYGSVDVYVNSGSVVFSLYADHGNRQVTQAASLTTGRWEQLSFGPASGTSNEFVLYTGVSGGDFYADNAYVGASPPSVPEPSTVTPFALAGLGLAGLVLRVRRQKKSAA